MFIIFYVHMISDKSVKKWGASGHLYAVIASQWYLHLLLYLNCWCYLEIFCFMFSQMWCLCPYFKLKCLHQQKSVKRFTVCKLCTVNVANSTWIMNVIMQKEEQYKIQKLRTSWVQFASSHHFLLRIHDLASLLTHPPLSSLLYLSCC